MPQSIRAGVAHTSAQSLAALSNTTKKGQLDQIFDICLSAQRNGVEDLSGKEIQQRYELQYGKRIESSTVAGRVNDLVTVKRLEKLTFSRSCAVTGRDIHPVRVPATQARLMY